MHKHSIAFVIAGTGLVATGLTASMGRTPQSTPSQTKSAFLIKDVRVFDGERVIPRTSVLIRDQKIVSVGVDVTAPAGVEVVPGEGRTLLPGLIDAHTHAFGDALERALVFGVTTELDMFTEHRGRGRKRSRWRFGSGPTSCSPISRCPA